MKITIIFANRDVLTNIKKKIPNLLQLIILFSMLQIKSVIERYEAFYFAPVSKFRQNSLKIQVYKFKLVIFLLKFPPPLRLSIADHLIDTRCIKFWYIPKIQFNFPPKTESQTSFLITLQLTIKIIPTLINRFLIKILFYMYIT